MKKIFIVSGIVLAALTSCSMEESSLTPEPGTGISVNFRGEAWPDTKISIGEQGSDDKWPVLWTEGDQIGIISRVETTFMNAMAYLNAEDAGKNSGIFVLNETVESIPSQDIVVYYPFSSYTNYSNGAVNSFVSLEQKQAKAGDTSHLGKYTTAYDAVHIDADGLDGSPLCVLPERQSYKYGTGA